MILSAIYANDEATLLVFVAPTTKNARPSRDDRAQLNSLNIKGNQLVIKHLLCNGLEAKALIDTGAAITAVSTELADSIKKSLKNWNGPSVSLANGQVVYPKQMA